MEGSTRLRVAGLALVAGVTLSVATCSDGTGPDQGRGVAPTATSLEPAPASVSVGVTAVVRVTFSEALDTATLAGALVVRSGGRDVAGRLVLQDGRTLVFTPTWPLDFGEVVEVSVAPTLRDDDGDLVRDPPTWTFRTEGDPPPTPTPSALEAHVTALAHDSLRGRGSGTGDERRAADHIAAFFQAAGLAPLDGVRRHAFTAVGARDGLPLSSQNVLGVLPGVGALAGEWVVLGAHYDHVGVRVAESGELEIHNGADDNASGTAVVMELARMYADYAASGGMTQRPRRSVLFALWGAEEKGLLGSCAFTGAGLLPTSEVTTLVNFDMVGRLRSNAVIMFGGESSATWPALLDQANRPGMALQEADACQSCSDHACFRRAGVPYLWFFTGLHDQYHRPGDDAPLLNYEGMAAIAEMAFRALTLLVVSETAPVFLGGGP